MTDLRILISESRLYCDGGFGSYLQSIGLPAGTPPEAWNLTHPEKIVELHRAYVEAGSNLITTNSFGVNKDKYTNYEEYIAAAVKCAKTAIGNNKNCFIAFDLGPSGRMLEPMGDLSFEDAVELFGANVRAAVKYGVDCIIIETMNDSYETKAAVLAAKENSDLPVLVTNAYDKSGKLMTGATPEAMIAMLEGLKVDAIGMNCSFGPDMMLSLVERFAANSSLPIIVNPNAGLPKIEDGKTVYSFSSDDFASYMRKIAIKGATILGGCCGTTPEYIKKTIQATRDIPFVKPSQKNITMVSSYTHSVVIDDKPILIGERINPTGKSKFKEALRNNDINYVLNEGIRQADKGVHILDVNVGMPEINEAEMMKTVVAKLQSVTDLPLQLDSSDPSALEKSMRIYNGKPMINSVNGDEKSMQSVFPLIRKYGGAVIALTMDENGIPETAAGRVSIAERIINKAREYGIEKKDIIVDPLCLTISSNQASALVTLEAVRILKERGCKVSLGVSNISFGLPAREKINSSFFNSALENGLNCAIMNPFADGMMDVYYAYMALHNMDKACEKYIAYASEQTVTEKVQKSQKLTLYDAIVKGLKDSAVPAVLELLESEEPLDIINKYVVPALNDVGISFEEKKIYLPQLLMSADAASAAFEKIKVKIPQNKSDDNKKIILATVKGDIHDIGKNIVKVLHESYGYKVYDLGKDVPPEKIIECIKTTGCKLVGLSSLMTTTVPSMAETIEIIHNDFDDVKVIVGGAVLTRDYSEKINADGYSPDAMGAVKLSNSFYDKSF